MSDHDFSVGILVEGDDVVLTLAGDMSGGAGTALSDALVSAMDGAPGAVILDFAEVGYINSTGIAAIIGLITRAEGRALRACGLTEHYREIFDITQLSRHIEVFPDVESAIDKGVAS